MNRVAFTLFGFSFYWYSIFIMIGVIIGSLIAYFELKYHKINKEVFFNMVFYAIIFGLLGARIYYVLFNMDYYSKHLIEIFYVWNGGLAIHGGIIGAILVFIYFHKKKKIPLLKSLDIGACSIIIGQSIGRWGNFFNSEAYGKPIIKNGIDVTYECLSKYFPDFIVNGMNINGTYYQPTFLYESFYNLIGFIILMILKRNKNIKDGMLFSIYLIWYGIGRFFIEILRTDALMLGNVKIAQIVSILIVIFGIILLVKSRKNNKFREV